MSDDDQVHAALLARTTAQIRWRVLDAPLQLDRQYATREVAEVTATHEVTKEDCTPATVNAAANCAARITDLLRVHLEAERLQIARRRQG
jgi:hypothetical protein